MKVDNFEHRLAGGLILSQPISVRFLSIFITAIVSIATVFIFSHSYAKKERVQGYLVPNKGLSRIYAGQRGVISEIEIKEGQRVSQGDELLKILMDTGLEGASYVGLELLKELEVQEMNLQKSILIERERLKESIAQFELQIAILKEEMLSLRKSMEIRNKIASMRMDEEARAKTLFSSGSISRELYDRSLERYLEGKSLLQDMRIQISQTNSKIQQLESEKRLAIVESKSIINSIKVRLSDLAEKESTIMSERVAVIRSPIDGYITNLSFNIGQSIEIGKSIMSIVPEESTLQAHLYVPTKAMGFLENGQQVNIRYDAFPYQKFGLYKGEVIAHSGSILPTTEIPIEVRSYEAAYRVIVAIEQQEILAFNDYVSLKPGMTLSADIVLSERSLIEWLFEPVFSLRGSLK